MSKRPRKNFTSEQRKELWQRWKARQSLSEIGRALSSHAPSIYCFLQKTGGMLPASRTRSPLALSAEEREDISRGLVADESFRTIAARLGRAPSTVSREVNRHGGRWRYRALNADKQAWQQAQRPKHCALALNRRLKNLVADKLKADWSPQQIAGWLKAEYPDDEAMQVSHETIYRSLYIQARGVLKRELMAHLRRKRTMRHGKTSTGQPRGQIIDAVSIADRPIEIEDRGIPGHWEGDLVSGSNNSHIATLVERQSRYVMLVQVAGKDTQSVVKGLIRQVQTLPSSLMASLTWDRGMELASHKQFTVATDVKVYFCDPKSPWQRGSNENTNGLLRQYFPHGTDLSQYTQRDLDRVALKLNTRPRKTLGFMTPAAKLAESVALTG
jgi:IS30 family transposase